MLTETLFLARSARQLTTNLGEYPTFKAEAQVAAPYTDFDGVTADPTVFTVA